MIPLLIIIGLLLLPYLYNLLFPFKPPMLDHYFSPGQTYISKAEGVTQTVLKQDGNKVYCELRFEPKAAGPTYHLHLNFNESATIMKGTLTTKVDGQINKLHVGDRLIFKKGAYHSMFNELDEEIIVRPEKEEDYVPVEFAYSLAQLYPFMDAEGGLTLKMFMKICVLDDLFDTVLYGPPPAFFKLVKKVIKPYARLFGATPYDEKSRPQ